MKIAVIVLGCVLIALSITAGGWILFTTQNQMPPSGVPDQNGSDNINVLLTRPENTGMRPPI